MEASPSDATDPTAAAESVSSSTTLVASHSGKCVDVRAKSTDPGAVIEQWTCNGGSNQSFALLPADPGYVFIKNDLSGLCLNVAGRSLSDGGLIIQWTCGVAAKNDQWRVISNADGTTSFVGHESGLCLEVPGSATSDGVQLDQATCTGGKNQAFSGAPSTTPPPATVRALQWNVEDGEQSDEITQVVEQKPQIAFLEEVDRVGHIDDIRAALAADQGAPFYFTSVNRDGSASGASNVGVISHWPLSNVKTKVLGYENEVICGIATNARAAVGATISIGGKELAVIGVRTYFDSTSCVAQTQVRRLKAWVASSYPGITALFAGDFNMSPGSAAYTSMTTEAPTVTDAWWQSVQDGTASAYTTPSFTTPTRSTRLDYLFFTAGPTTLKVKDATIAPLVAADSDHRQVIVDFALP